MTRACLPTEIPRGALIVADGLIADEVSVWRTRGLPLVAVSDAAGRIVLYDPGELVLVDENTAERRALRAAARPLLQLIHGGR